MKAESAFVTIITQTDDLRISVHTYLCGFIIAFTIIVHFLTQTAFYLPASTASHRDDIVVAVRYRGDGSCGPTPARRVLRRVL